MALLDKLEGTDKFDIIENKLNDTIDAVNSITGGDENEILVKKSSDDFDVKWTNGIVSSEEILYNTGWASGGSGGTVVTLDIMGRVEMDILLTIATGGNSEITTLPEAYRPSRAKRFAIRDYNGSEGDSGPLSLTIGATGVVTLVSVNTGSKPANRVALLATISYSIR